MSDISPYVYVEVKIPVEDYLDLDCKAQESGKTVSDLINGVIPDILSR